MQIEVEKKLFTRDEFSRMFEAGILDENERFELIGGEILKMSNPGRRHIACTNRATRLFSNAFGGRAIVSIQNPVALDVYNELKPDVVVLKPRDDFYDSIDIASEHALLLVEISQTTLSFDRKIKLPHYARCGVREFWIEDLKNDLLLVFREPVGDNYTVCLSFHRGQEISPVAFPDVVFKVEDLLG